MFWLRKENVLQEAQNDPLVIIGGTNTLAIVK